MKKKNLTLFLLFVFIGIYSCSDKDENLRAEYNPNEPVKLTTFYPDSGGLGTKMIIQGSNFGADTSKIRVYFNEKRATIISAQGDRMYLFAPRLPGDTCILSVVVGNDSVTFDKTFQYLKRFNVTTLTVPATENTHDYFANTTLDETKLGEVNCIGVDSLGNIFIANVSGECTFINEAENLSINLFKGDKLNAPTVGAGGIVYVPGDRASEYYELNPEEDWLPRYRLITQPSEPEKQFVLDWKHSFAFNENGYVYTAANNDREDSQLIRFDVKTRVGEKVATLRVRNSDTYLYFDPNDHNILYMVHTHKHCIYRYYLDTGEQELFAGTEGQSGWRDGHLQEAEFSGPRQIALGPDGFFYVADEENHCIRQITPDGYVNTILGQGGRHGFQDGNPDDALFHRPRGVALDQEGNIYVTDTNNRSLRKLTMD